MYEGIFWALLGLIIGSFLNVLILRHGKGSIRGRSACPRCHTPLQWFELIPVLSWIILRGRCRTCSKRISAQYPLVELAAGMGFLTIGLAPVAPLLKIVGAAIIALYVAIAVYDLYHTIIPDVWVWPLNLLAFLWGMISVATLTGAGWVFLSGILVAAPLYALWLVSKGAWMGLGDAKFALGIGFLLGIAPGFIALGLAFILGALVGVFILLPLPHIMRQLQRTGITRSSHLPEGYTMKSEVPFGPFLICATFVVWIAGLYGADVVALSVAFLSLS